MNFETYFSSWIANLGVVPLLLLAAFLFLPIFFNLLALLVLEIRVFETITSLLAGNSFQHSYFINKIKYLPISTQTVKGLGWIILSLYYSPSIAAKQPETLLMARGEHKEWKFPQMGHFTIGNPEVISHKFSNKNKTLLIKGKKLGFTELIVWEKNKSKKSFHIYILSKQKHLKILHIAQTLKTMGLKVQTAGPLLIATGEVAELGQYQLIQKLKSQYSKQLHLEVKLARKLRNQIIAEVYRTFYRHNLDDIYCDYQELQIQCYYPQNFPLNHKIIKRLETKYSLSFQPIQTRIHHNFLAKIKLVQIENTKGDEFQLGLDQLKGSLSNFFEEGLNSLIQENQIFLRKNNLTLSTLAEPQIIIRNDKQAIIEIGSNIPYPSFNGELTQTEWKFAGLKIILKVIKQKQDFHVDFKIEFTRPGQGGQISGSREESTASIPSDKPFNLFQIGFQAQGNHESKLPGLGNIPLLGKLFTSSSNQSSYKQILGYITIEEINESN